MAAVIVPPELLKRYRPGRRLGEGGMGLVFAATQIDLEREVAVKLVKGMDAEQTARFVREGKLLASLSSPYIVRVYDAGADGDMPYLVMELVDGETLEAAHVRATLPLPRALEVVADVCAALEDAAAQGLIHRDVKPANVFLAREGQVKLADFGLARLAEGQSSLTPRGVVLGTLDYMSPEQVLGQRLTPASDQYSVGVLLYWLVTGRVPWIASTPDQAAAARLEGPPLPPGALRADLPRDVDALILRCLSTDPRERHASHAAVREALLRAVAAGGRREPSGSRSGGGARPEVRAKTVAAPRRPARAGAWTLAAGAALIAAAGMGIARRAGGPSSSPAPTVAVAAEVGPDAAERAQVLAAADGARQLRVLARLREGAKLPPLAELSREAAARCAALLRRGGALLDDRAAPAAERRRVYDGLTELRVLDLLLELNGATPLGAEGRLGSRFETAATRPESADPQPKVGAAGRMLRLNHASAGDADPFTDVASLVSSTAPPLALDVDDRLRRCDRAWVRLPVTSTWTTRTILLVTLAPLPEGPWTLLFTAHSGRSDGRQLFLLHRLDPSLLRERVTLSGEVLNLPASIPGAWPRQSDRCELVGWRD